MSRFSETASLLQSLARELGPLGVHVAHVVVDGAVDNVNTRYWQHFRNRVGGKPSPLRTSSHCNIHQPIKPALNIAISEPIT